MQIVFRLRKSIILASAYKSLKYYSQSGAALPNQKQNKREDIVPSKQDSIWFLELQPNPLKISIAMTSRW
jgi:hypothetical protein